MAKYISLVAVLAEIDKRLADNKKDIERASHKNLEDYFEGYEDALTLFKDQFLDTFEAKEVDLEKEIDRVWDNTSDNFSEDGWKEFEDIAKHFFELGLKVQHDNWKVVDNINPLQADRNKIYCVLSKNKYFLAKVTGHPQDQDLLQWRCTEFPFHRYDMCEGDKYMQIV